jgi:hypothetical protein
MGKVLQRIERRRYIWLRIIPNITNVILIGSLLLALSFAFNFNGFRDSFQNWYEIAFFFWLIFLAPSLPSTFYEWYEKIKDSLIETHEFNQEEASISEEEVYLFDGSKITYYPKKLFRFLSPRKLFRMLRGDF